MKRKFSTIYAPTLDSVLQNKFTYQPLYKKSINWNRWIPATKTRNAVLNDHLSDWLDLNFNRLDINTLKLSEKPVSRNYTSKTVGKGNFDNFTLSLFEKGKMFERKVVDVIKATFDKEFIEIGDTFDAREYANYEKTIEAMKEGIPIIYSGVVRDYENETYGCPDLIVRSDYINKLSKFKIDIEEGKSPICKGNYYYVAVEIKFSVLELNTDGVTVRNTLSSKPYKAQLCVYNMALNRMQQYRSSSTYIIGKGWKCGKDSGNYFLDRLGEVNFHHHDAEYVDITLNAVDWYRKLRENGHEWKLDPPSIKELYPNMKIQNSKWYRVKNIIAEKIKDITLVWNCGIKERDEAFCNEIYTYDDINCCPINLGFKITSKKAKVIDTLLKVNNCELKEIIYPSTTQNLLFKSNRKEIQEFYIDFETIHDTQIVDHFPYIEKIDFIFMIGVAYFNNNQWIYKSFIMKDLSMNSEKEMITSFSSFMKNIINNNNKPNIYHWGHAERSFLRHAVERHNKFSELTKNYEWIDLLKEMRDEKTPIAVKGMKNYNLKSTVSKINDLNLYEKIIFEEGLCMNGMDAMILAEKEYSKNNQNIEENIIMKNIEKYNEMDCKSMYIVLKCLRDFYDNK